MPRTTHRDYTLVSLSLLVALLVAALPEVAWAVEPPTLPEGTGPEEGAQDSAAPAGKFSGLMWGDFYYMAANHDERIEGQNGFWFRRVYFTYDHELGEGWDTRLRLEVNSPGDFDSSSKLEPTVKDAYVRWRSGDTSVYVGISSTPS